MNRFLNTRELADMLHVSIFYIREQVKAGKIECIDLGNKFLFESKEVEKFIKSLPIKTGN